jgi:tmRNA-binding protein
MKTPACQIKASKRYYEKNKESIHKKAAQKYRKVMLHSEFVDKIQQQAKEQNMSMIELIMSKFK